MIITDRIPDVGIVKDRNAITGVGTWVVTCSLTATFRPATIWIDTREGPRARRGATQRC
jgi:hypothetical protein